MEYITKGSSNRIVVEFTDYDSSVTYDLKFEHSHTCKVVTMTADPTDCGDQAEFIIKEGCGDTDDVELRIGWHTLTIEEDGEEVYRDDSIKVQIAEETEEDSSSSAST